MNEDISRVLKRKLLGTILSIWTDCYNDFKFF